MKSHAALYLAETARIARTVDAASIERIVAGLRGLRAAGGRLFLLGVGGSAANSSHAVNDLRKLNGIEAYAPTDNVAELTARTNDDGFQTVFEEWLKVSHACGRDALFILSVGGGSVETGISVPLVRAIDEAKRRGMRIYGIVGRAEGYTARMADEVVIIPIAHEARVTPHAESFQSVVLHAISCHPDLTLADTAS
jgi:D-sedoheptulose 7-phosphate isomerase